MMSGGIGCYQEASVRLARSRVMVMEKKIEMRSMTKWKEDLG